MSIRLLPLCDAFDGTLPKRHDLGSGALGRGPVRWADRSAITEHFTQGALEFIQKAESAGNPFYVNLWPDDVHSPFFPPEARRGDGEKRSLYRGVLDTMDEPLGVLFDYIRGRDSLRENTLIVVCSDIGPEQRAGSAGSFRGFKTKLYEGGIRLPLIVWGPGLVKKSGYVNKTSFFWAIDLVPALLSLAGIRTFEHVQIDGEEILDTLVGAGEEGRQTPLFFRQPPDRDAYCGVEDLPDLAVRWGHRKLLCEYDGSRPELCDLAKDPGEQENLAADQGDLVTQLTELVVGWHKSMPGDNGATFRR